MIRKRAASQRFVYLFLALMFVMSTKRCIQTQQTWMIRTTFSQRWLGKKEGAAQCTYTTHSFYICFHQYIYIRNIPSCLHSVSVFFSSNDPLISGTTYSAFFVGYDVPKTKHISTFTKFRNWQHYFETRGAKNRIIRWWRANTAHVLSSPAQSMMHHFIVSPCSCGAVIQKTVVHIK